MKKVYLRGRLSHTVVLVFLLFCMNKTHAQTTCQLTIQPLRIHVGETVPFGWAFTASPVGCLAGATGEPTFTTPSGAPSSLTAGTYAVSISLSSMTPASGFTLASSNCSTCLIVENITSANLGAQVTHTLISHPSDYCTQGYLQNSCINVTGLYNWQVTPGSGYTSAPTVTVTGCTVPPIVTLTVTSGALSLYTATSGEYCSGTITYNLSGGGGTGGAVTATAAGFNWTGTTDNSSAMAVLQLYRSQPATTCPADTASSYYRIPQEFYFPSGPGNTQAIYLFTSNINPCDDNLQFIGDGADYSVIQVPPNIFTAGTCNLANSSNCTDFINWSSLANSSDYHEFIGGLGFWIGYNNPGLALIREVSNNVGNFGTHYGIYVKNDDGTLAATIDMSHAYPGPTLIQNIESIGANQSIYMSEAEYLVTGQGITSMNDLSGACITNTNGSLSIEGLWCGENNASSVGVNVTNSNLYSTSGPASLMDIVDGQFENSLSATNAISNGTSRSMVIHNINVNGYTNAMVDNYTGVSTVWPGNVLDGWSGTTPVYPQGSTLIPPTQLWQYGVQQPVNVPEPTITQCINPSTGISSGSGPYYFFPYPCDSSAPVSLCAAAGPGCSPTTWATTMANAVASGQSTVYTVPGAWNLSLSQSITVPLGIDHIACNYSEYGQNNGPTNNSGQFITLIVSGGNASSVPLWIDNCLMNFIVDQESLRPVIISNGTIGGSAPVSYYAGLTSGIAGTAYFEDVTLTPGVGFINGQHVYMIQADLEGPRDIPPAFTPATKKIYANGSILWILGYKSERVAEQVWATNGAQFKGYGLWLYPVGCTYSANNPLNPNTSKTFPNTGVSIVGNGNGTATVTYTPPSGSVAFDTTHFVSFSNFTTGNGFANQAVIPIAFPAPTNGSFTFLSNLVGTIFSSAAPPQYPISPNQCPQVGTSQVSLFDSSASFDAMQFVGSTTSATGQNYLVQDTKLGTLLSVPTVNHWNIPIANFSISSGVITFTVTPSYSNNIITNQLQPGMITVISGLTTTAGLTLNGNQTVLTATPTTFTVSTSLPNQSTTTDSGYATMPIQSGFSFSNQLIPFYYSPAITPGVSCSNCKFSNVIIQ